MEFSLALEVTFASQAIRNQGIGPPTGAYPTVSRRPPLHKSALAVLHSVVQRRNTVGFFKQILKIGLAGIAQVGTDICKAGFTVDKHVTSLLQLALCNKSVYRDSQFLSKTPHQIEEKNKPASPFPAASQVFLTRKRNVC